MDEIKEEPLDDVDKLVLLVAYNPYRIESYAEYTIKLEED